MRPARQLRQSANRLAFLAKGLLWLILPLLVVWRAVRTTLSIETLMNPVMEMLARPCGAAPHLSTRSFSSAWPGHPRPRRVR
jgi:hypothetical protein